MTVPDIAQETRRQIASYAMTETRRQIAYLIHTPADPACDTRCQYQVLVAAYATDTITCWVRQNPSANTSIKYVSTRRSIPPYAMSVPVGSIIARRQIPIYAMPAPPYAV
eukprot:998646-Rhodomonas_salina.4